MDYHRIYYELISYRQDNILTSGYKEVHHILPRSLGGTNEQSNLVALTGREHYIAHLLLARFNQCSQTSYSLWMMQMKNSKDSSRPCIKNSRMYEWARKEFAKYISKHNSITQQGKLNSQYGKIWISNIELKETTRIDNILLIPDGWVKGRNAWNKVIAKRQFIDIASFNKICKTCGENISYKKRKHLYCSKSCKTRDQHINENCNYTKMAESLTGRNLSESHKENLRLSALKRK
jgi:hypothetical protein